MTTKTKTKAKAKGKPQPKPRGQPSLLTPQFIETAVTLCSSLATDIAVCRALKVSTASWCQWKLDAAAGRQPHQRMFEQIEEARGLKAIQLVSNITSDPDWKAKAWLLERLEPETYSIRHRHRVELTGKNGAPLPAATLPGLTIVLQGPISDNPYEPDPPAKKS